LFPPRPIRRSTFRISQMAPSRYTISCTSRLVGAPMMAGGALSLRHWTMGNCRGIRPAPNHRESGAGVRGDRRRSEASPVLLALRTSRD
jgi:hypothetical protein